MLKINVPRTTIKEIYAKAVEGLSIAPFAAEPINIIFDGPPGPESCSFVEVETDNGKGINAGEWIERPDGLWALRITSLPGKP